MLNQKFKNQNYLRVEKNILGINFNPLTTLLKKLNDLIFWYKTFYP